MKTKSIWIVLAVLAINIQSCSEFLKEEMVSDVAASTYYTTVAGFEDAVDATYSFLKPIYSQERSHTLTIFGTDTHTNGADGNHKSFNYYDNGLSSANSHLTELWQNLYRGVNQANAVIDRGPGIVGLDPAILTVRTAEARFLRALYYFNLVRQWGDVHLSLKETVVAEVEANKTPQADIYDLAIVPDLEFAIANLPNSQSQYGRATKPAAEHLLGLVLLTRGYQAFAKVDDLTRAEQLFSNVILNYGFKLEPTHASLWNQDNQRNKEVVFAIQASVDPLLNGDGNRSHLYFLMEYDIQPGMQRDIANGRPFKRFRPTNFLLDIWGANRANDSRYDMTYKHVWYCNNTANIPTWTQANVDAGAKNKDGSLAVVGKPKFSLGDTAIFIPGPGQDAKWTAAKKLQTRYRVYTRNEYTERIFPSLNKQIDPKRLAVNTEEGSRDWFLFRLGDTYLLRAEARFKSGNLQGAADDINVIRRRAAWTVAQQPLMEITAANVTLDYIMEERARELDGEQCRWYDLTRTLTLVNRVKLYNPLGAVNIGLHHVRRPIPQIQIDRTLGGYLQNCGYPGADACM